ncbi:trehalose-phosphatase [Sabulicella glaciei]|uniref:Trehalose 6-phosphate phosphatase n=1 Tax=Sabulicella glaciei TaxID=2984948 RepID=A0ABT3NTZ5_9PROT|nr:trehalose-phosphatase [Roseococcus sp. MDT2-1-1]MCW8085625.1 trehalose-phosphatase [Roseococcus sp. MDT2-1-1]
MASNLPEIASDWALFLDLDGTLLDIAPRPDAVVVPLGLVDSLRGVAARLGGAAAIVSGRPVSDVDRFLAPLAMPGGFGHGTEIRLPGGAPTPSQAARTVPREWLDRLREAASGWPGVLVEPKPHGVAMHFRLAPEREAEVHGLMQRCASECEGYALLPAHMAFELRPTGASKALPVEVLMRHAPFGGRRPVFVGDDVTDEDGMEAARRHGGFGLHVGRDFQGGSAEVRAWLARGASA